MVDMVEWTEERGQRYYVIEWVDDVAPCSLFYFSWSAIIEGNFFDVNIYKCKYSFHTLTLKSINYMEVLQKSFASLLWFMH